MRMAFGFELVHCNQVSYHLADLRQFLLDPVFYLTNLNPLAMDLDLRVAASETRK
jgi:hypothetical protein